MAGVSDPRTTSDGGGDAPAPGGPVPPGGPASGGGTGAVGHDHGSPLAASPTRFTPRGLAYRVVEPDSGAGDAPWLFLVMGLGQSGAMWWRLLPHVAREHRVVVYDNRGTGLSPRVGRRLSLGALVADAVDVLDTAGVDRAHVLGASMGGMVAQHLALDHRERVASLGLACTTAHTRAALPNWRLGAATVLRPVAPAALVTRIVTPALYSAAAVQARPDRLAEDLRVRRREAARRTTALRQALAIGGHDTRDRLGELAGLRVLVVHGTDDAVVPVERGRELARLVPGARLVELPDTGHVLLTDSEEATAAAVLEHLRAARTGAPGPV